jgi:transcriptional accessory protein Tex/SPT6
VDLSVDDESKHSLIQDFFPKLAPPSPFTATASYQDACLQVLQELLNLVLLPELTREIRSELTESAENYVIHRAQRTYEQMLMTGPFTRDDLADPFGGNLQSATTKGRKSGGDDDTNDRPRINVMSVIMQ